MSDLTDKIRSRGHWDIAVRPARFDDDRIQYAELDNLLQTAVVRFRGWPVPFIDHREPLQRGDKWIGQDIDASMVDHYEAWRFFTSGLFNQLRSVSADWRTGREVTYVPPGFNTVVEVWEILFYLTEVFELATRLALSAAGDDEMTIEAELLGLTGRGLVVGQRTRAEFIQPYPAPSGRLRLSTTLTKDQLVGDPRGQAVDLAIEFFARFGWHPAREQLLDHQRELTER